MLLSGTVGYEENGMDDLLVLPAVMCPAVAGVAADGRHAAARPVEAPLSRRPALLNVPARQEFNELELRLGSCVADAHPDLKTP